MLSFLPAKKAQSPNDKNILVENGLSSMKESVEFFCEITGLNFGELVLET